MVRLLHNQWITSLTMSCGNLQSDGFSLTASKANERQFEQLWTCDMLQKEPTQEKQTDELLTTIHTCMVCSQMVVKTVY